MIFIANAISGIAQGISMIAIPWYFAQQGELANFGLIYLFTNIISLFWMPYSGTIIDKYDRKHVFLVIALIGGITIGAIASFGMINGNLPLMVVGSVFMLTFLNYNIHYPCLYAFVQELTDAKYYYKLSSLLEIIGQITTISSGAVATLLLEGTQEGKFKIFGSSIDLGFEIQPWSISQIFALDASTYFIAFLIILMIRYQPVKIRKFESGSMVKRLTAGFNYLKERMPIFIFGVLSFMVFLAMLLEAFYLGVSYVDKHLQESGDVYANSKIAYSMGAIFIGLTIRFLFKFVNIPLAIIFLTFVGAAIFITLSLSHSLIIFFCMMILLGITNAGVRVARMTYLFKNIDNQFFGRSGSIFFVVSVILRIILLSIFSISFFQYSNNIIYAYWIIAFVLLTSAIWMIKDYKTFDLSLNKN